MKVKQHRAFSVVSAALFAALPLCAANAYGQAERGPHIGYLYPAGGRTGSVFTLVVGGQYLQNVSDVYVSGGGVRVAGIKHIGRRIQPLNREQLQELRRRLDEIRMTRSGHLLAEAPPAGPNGQPPKPAASKKPVMLPYHVLLNNLDNLTENELRLVEKEFLDPVNHITTKEAIADRVLIELMIDPDAAPGDRQLRLVTPGGLTNPMCFQIGSFPEYAVEDLSDPASAGKPPSPATVVELPAVVNGQILPGQMVNGQLSAAQVDRFRFHAQRGQRLVFQAQARHLIPYLADAVPGWFQAVITLYDAQGKNELACADHYRFDPDPVIFFEVPADGDYQLEVRDSIYRGREDFVYRVSISESPFIATMFPLGGRSGETVKAALTGWNLPSHAPFTLDTAPGGEKIRMTPIRADGTLYANSLPYAVDTLPECRDLGANDSARTAQRITLPVVVNGKIEQPGRAKVFQFQGRAGDEVVAEVVARRLGSPLDSLLRLTDAAGKELAVNDDSDELDPSSNAAIRSPDSMVPFAAGLLTHQADSYLRAKLPADGTYYLTLTDAQGNGSDAHAWRLRVSAPQPDFALRAAPSAININANAGRPITVWLYALRKDGFDGDIEVTIKDGEKTGLTLIGGTKIPHGRDSVRMTLMASRSTGGKAVALSFEGRAPIAGETVTRPTLPADNLMQAFAYYHLVAAQEMLLTVNGQRSVGPPAFWADSKAAVRVPAAGEARVHINCPPQRRENLRFELLDPPKGISLGDPSPVPKEGVEITLKAGPDAPAAGYADNLIVAAYMEQPITGQGGVPTGQKQRQPMGILPAIAFEIVPPDAVRISNR